MSKLIQILIADSPASAMTPRTSVRAVPGRGLEGDRYFTGTGTFAKNPQQPDFELTLIESECVENFARKSGLPFTALHARRNLVTQGVALNDLVGREFVVGTVRVRGLRLCEPCNYLAKTTWPAVLRGLVHQGGLRAQILTDGVIQVGDAITTASRRMPHEFRHGDYLLSDDPTRIDADAVHAFLTRSYWAEGIPREVVARALAHSLCLGIYTNTGAQIGLVRVITDYATFAYLCDVYVLEAHRGRGLSKVAMKFTLAHPRLQGLRNWSLRTRDAHGLYAQFGFKPLDHPENSMTLRFPDVYKCAAPPR